MKKVFSLLAVSVLGSVVFCSCSGGDDNNSGGGTVTPETVVDDKKFLDETAQEFVRLFNASQTANYASIYNAIKDTEAAEFTDEEIDDIIEGLKHLTQDSPDLKIYKYAIKAAAFKGRYVLKNDGLWYKENANGFTAVFTDNNGRQCEAKVTLSGETKNVVLFDDEDINYRYEWNENLGYYTWYEDGKEQYIYEAELPSHIECVLTQGGSQLVNVEVDIVGLNNLSEGQKVNLSSNSLSFTCTADFRDVAKISVTKASYQAQGKSEVSIDVEKNGKKILTANATTDSNLRTQAPEEWDDKDVERINNTDVSMNILDKIQIKGTCNNINSLINTLDKANDYENRYNREAVKQFVDLANTYLKANVYYYNTSDVRASLKFDVDYKEVYYYDYNSNSNSTRTKYFPVSSICFPDGTSYFMENYFTEDAFKVLVDMVNDLGDDIEDQFDSDK